MISAADDRPHVTAPAACALDPWQRVGSFELAFVRDTAEGLIARQTWRGAYEYARGLGLSLISRAQVYAWREAADHVLEPIALPDRPLAAAYGVPWDAVALQRLRTQKMGTVAWSRYHDAKQDAQIAALPSGGLVFRMKPWIKDADGALAGWYTEHLERYSDRHGAGYVQQGLSAPHPGHSHHDYATPTVLVRPFVPSWFDRLVADAGAAFSRLRSRRRATLGERALAWALEFEGLAEVPGPKHNPTIVAWGDLCRRGGVYLGRVDGRDRWTASAVRVSSATDEEAWCAKFASAALAGVLGEDEAPPHGLRVSVAELCTDARALGSLRMPGYAPRVGDLMILARAGGNPLHGGTGHVARVLSLDPLVTIGGNEAPGPGQVHRTPRRYADAVAWIAYPEG